MMSGSGKKEFDEWYETVYGCRWRTLREALLREPVHYELAQGLVKPYFLDEASYTAARLLGTSPGEKILDMCAAPGGKSLVIAGDLGGSGRLVANDRSSARRARLHRILNEHLPPKLRDTVTVTGHDAAKWGIHEPGEYDRILLDAPCSSERHVISSERHLKQWSPTRTRRLAAQAYAMLCSAYLSVKVGGVVLYCTCALSPMENDETVARFLKKKAVSTLPVSCRFGEATDFGVQIFPDTSAGRGPIYLAKIRRDE